MNLDGAKAKAHLQGGGSGNQVCRWSVFYVRLLYIYTVKSGFVIPGLTSDEVFRHPRPLTSDEVFRHPRLDQR